MPAPPVPPAAPFLSALPSPFLPLLLPPSPRGGCAGARAEARAWRVAAPGGRGTDFVSVWGCPHLPCARGRRRTTRTTCTAGLESLRQGGRRQVGGCLGRRGA